MYSSEKSAWKTTFHFGMSLFLGDMLVYRGVKYTTFTKIFPS